MNYLPLERYPELKAVARTVTYSTHESVYIYSAKYSSYPVSHYRGITMYEVTRGESLKIVCFTPEDKSPKILSRQKGGNNACIHCIHAKVRSLTRKMYRNPLVCGND